MSQNKEKRGLFGRLLGSRDTQEPAEQPPVEPPAETAEIDTSAAAPGAESADQPATSVAMESTEAPRTKPPDDGQPRTTQPGAADAETGEKSGGGWFSRLKSGLSKTSAKISSGITGIFTRQKLDAETLEDFEDLLLQADLGVETSSRIIDRISGGRYEKGIPPEEVRSILVEEVTKVLEPVAKELVVDPGHRPHVVLMVGVNGTGKTTTIGKLAQQFVADGKKVMVAAGDTFRAAAIDQLKVWGDRTGATVIARDVGADAAGVAYDALNQARSERYDVLLIDTAGRLQNKQALMEELEKVVRVIGKLDPDAPHDCLLVLDATTGQNAMSQVEVFKERAGVTGLVMTKLDGTARGGILVSIAARHQIPVVAIGVGEGVDDLQAFSPAEFASAIASG